MRCIASLCALLILLPFPLPAAHQLQTVTIDQDLSKVGRQGAQTVMLTVTVTNGRDEHVTGLRQEDFVVLLDKVPQRIDDFSDEYVPASVGVLFDVSHSMAVRSINIANLRTYKDALTQFFEHSNRSNEYFLMGFSQRPQLLMDWTSDANAILERFSSVQFKGNTAYHTAFFDACYVGLEKVMQGKYNKRAIILISDGLNTESSYTHDQVRRLLRQSNVTVYSINIPGDESDAGSSLAYEGQAIMNELSLISGGMTFYHDESQRLHSSVLNYIFARIADELHRQYFIGFVPSTKPTKDQWHRIKVNVRADHGQQKMRGLTVRTREGYYAASN
jgi:Ca-activated chloride channel homolog